MKPTSRHCQHVHTVVMELEPGDWEHPPRWAHLPPWTHVRLTSGHWVETSDDDGKTWTMPNDETPPAVDAGLRSWIATVPEICGCDCSERLRTESLANRLTARNAVDDADLWIDRATYMEMAANFLDAAPDARGSDLSAEQPEVRVSDLTGVYQSTSEPKTTMNDWLAARHDDQEATDG